MDGSQALIVVNFKQEEQTIEIPFPAGDWKLELSSQSSTPENLLKHIQLPVLKQQSLPISGSTALLYISL